MADPTPTSPAERFAGRVLDTYCRWLGDLYAEDLQQDAVEYGLLAPVTVSQPCADGYSGTCRCAEYGDWPVTCYRLTDAGRAAIAAAQAA